MKYELFGESHGPAIGIVLTGVPAGLELDMEWILAEMERRAPGKDKTSTARREKDMPEILSGVLENRTTGAPLCAMIHNTDQQSSDYSQFRNTPRPSHSDYPASVRYQGYHDIRGGGHFSGRLTAPLVFAGAVAKQYLALQKIGITSQIMNIGGVENPTEAQMEETILEARADQDSVGGIVRIRIENVPAGIGGPDLGENIEGELARAMFAIPAVKGIQFGSGFQLASMRGSQANDALRIRDGKVVTETNHAGGINGGISNGMPIEFDVVFRPTPSIGKEQNTVDLAGMEDTTLQIRGRHDPCVVLRARPVVEAAAAITMMDLIQNQCENI